MANGTTKATLIDTIYSNILRDITLRVLQPGQKINLKELSERYSSSQTPIKLARNRLVSEKVIENYPRQGMAVRSVSIQEVREIFEMRLMLYLNCIDKVIMTINYNRDLHEELTRNVEEHTKVIESLTPDSPVDEYLKNYQLDHLFHKTYLKCSGSKKMLELYDFLNPFLYTNYIFRRQSKEKDLAGVREHSVILSAIEAEDGEKLRNALELHILRARNTVALILQVEEIESESGDKSYNAG
jgi:DNA-binding GntR family transcriptional regulator